MKAIQLSIEKSKKEIRESLKQISNSNNIDYYFLFEMLKDILLELEPKKAEELKKLQEEDTNKGDVNGKN